jgi:hypothetical protein
MFRAFFPISLKTFWGRVYKLLIFLNFVSITPRMARLSAKFDERILLFLLMVYNVPDILLCRNDR